MPENEAEGQADTEALPDWVVVGEGVTLALPSTLRLPVRDTVGVEDFEANLVGPVAELHREEEEVKVVEEVRLGEEVTEGEVEEDTEGEAVTDTEPEGDGDRDLVRVGVVVGEVEMVALGGLERLPVRDAELQEDRDAVEQVEPVKLGLPDMEGEEEEESEGEGVPEGVTEEDMVTDLVRVGVVVEEVEMVPLGGLDRLPVRDAELQEVRVLVTQIDLVKLGLADSEGEEEEDTEGEGLKEGVKEGDADTEMLRVGVEVEEGEVVAFESFERVEVLEAELHVDLVPTREALRDTVPLLDWDGDWEVEVEWLGEADGEVVTEGETEEEAEGDTDCEYTPGAFPRATHARIKIKWRIKNNICVSSVG